MPKLSPSASKAAKQSRMKEEMGKFKRGTLHSGSRTGPVVKSREQAIAISLSEVGLSKNKRKSTRSSGRKSGRR
jgi:hypothetical protein